MRSKVGQDAIMPPTIAALGRKREVYAAKAGPGRDDDSHHRHSKDELHSKEGGGLVCICQLLSREQGLLDDGV